MNILGGVIYTYVRQFEKRQQNAKRLSKFVENGISSPELKHKRNSNTTLISYEEDDKHRTVWPKLIIKSMHNLYTAAQYWWPNRGLGSVLRGKSCLVVSLICW